MQRRGWVAIGVVGVAAVLVPILLVTRVNEVVPEPTIEVPSIVGLQPAEAEQVLAERGLRIDASRSGCYSEFPLDFYAINVAGQRPLPGTLVTGAEPVYISLAMPSGGCGWVEPPPVRRTNVASLVRSLLSMAWLGAIVFVWTDAKRRGERAWLWLVATIALGVFALGLWLLVRRTLPKGEPFEDHAHLLGRH